MAGADVVSEDMRRAASGPDLSQAMLRVARTVETALDNLLPVPEGAEARLADAMRYATLGGGKRMRAFLVMETAALYSVSETCAARVAASIEMLHAYSLVHDDLPAMDDDDLRRGKPSTHKAFDEATAILAGDALQTRAFEVLAEPDTHSDPQARCELVMGLGAASGARGMAGGQMIDMLAEGQHVDHLPASHPTGTRGRSQPHDQLAPRLRVRMRVRLRQHLECAGLERVARQDRRRLIERLVRGRLAPAQIVVVHRRQIVMHQRIAVQHLDRRRYPRRTGLRHREQGRGLHHQERPHPLAATQRRIAHRLRQTPFRPFHGRQQRCQRSLNDAGDVEAALEALLPPVEGAEGRLAEAMRYATLGGGKRMRAFLVMQTSALFSVSETCAARVAASVEMLHGYSLVHDDLPAMDDDDLRRGKPSTHKAFDEATAILAGDALQTRAFEVLAEPDTHSDPQARCELVMGLGAASGARGMAGGQMIDMLAEGETLDGPAIARLQALKTGRLIQYSAEAGAILGRAQSSQRHLLAAYGRDIGAAFQIADDLLDAEGSTEETGKTAGKDAAAGKATMVAILGVERARAQAELLALQAAGHLEGFGERARLLRSLATYVVTRRN